MLLGSKEGGGSFERVEIYFVILSFVFMICKCTDVEVLLFLLTYFVLRNIRFFYPKKILVPKGSKNDQYTLEIKPQIIKC